MPETQHAPAKTVCVFCSSSDALRREYVAHAEVLGRLIGARGGTLVFGAGAMGLMGAIARSVHESGGRVIGVIPRALDQDGIVYRRADELIITDDLRERKAHMDARADAFVALPGGFGTIEEILEHMTLKQLRYHPKPIVLLNTSGYYDKLLAFFDHLMAERFAKPEHRKLYYVASTPEAVMDYIDSYEPPLVPDKYY